MVQRKSFAAMTCPIARSVEHVGDWWSILILREAFAGTSRFDQFRENLEIAPNMLTRRLTSLVDAGLIGTRRYSERPPRDEYFLTERGLDFRRVLIALYQFGSRHFSEDGPNSEIVDRVTGEPAEPVLADRKSGKILSSVDFRFVRRAGKRSTGANPDIARYDAMLEIDHCGLTG